MIKSCLRQEYNLVDAQLNKAYGEAYRYIEQVPRTGVKKPDTEQLNLLKKSQRAWLDFRDKECELILSNEDLAVQESLPATGHTDAASTLPVYGLQ